MTIRHLDALNHLHSIAVVGGSSKLGSLGTRVLENIIDGRFAGTVFAVNPDKVELEDVWWVPTIAALPRTPDIAVIVTPAATIPAIIGELGTRGTRVVVVISSTPHDAAAHQAMLDAARPYGVRLIGPNCLGVLLPHVRLNASFAPRNAAPGRLAFLSQSGALVTAMLDWAADRHVGFSGVVSVGDMIDVDMGDLIDFYAGDPHTDAILLYVEQITNPAKFMSAARAASRIKPVIAIKAGRTDGAGKAAFSHTGALTGSYEVYAAAFRRAGIILVETLGELFDAAQILSRYRPPYGDRLAIVSNGGGAGVLAADALAGVGAGLASLSPGTIAALDPDLPANWSRANPVDVVGDARSERFAAATRGVLADDNVDAALVIHCPTAVATGEEIARAVIAARAEAECRKPLIACWMGPRNAEAARSLFDDAGIPVFDNLDDAVRAFGYLAKASQARQALMRAPAHQLVPASDRARARAVIVGARSEGRDHLSATEAKAVVAAYGIGVVPGVLARDSDAIAKLCATLPAPYAVKVVSPQLPHKSDVGGVALNVATIEDAQRVAVDMAARLSRDHPKASITGFEIETMVNSPSGRELLIGVASDPTFGPVIAFGAGGKAVQVMRDVAFGLPPLDSVLAGEMIDATRVSHLLGAYRDVPAADIEAVVRALTAVSALVVDLPEIAELDINPLMADENGVIALDARIRLSLADVGARLVVRPAPMEWAADLTTRGGVAMHVRPILPDDEDALADLFRHVTTEDLRFRFMTGLREVGRDRLVAMTQIDYWRTMHFLAFAPDGTAIASAVLACDPDRERAELAVSVRSDFKGKGVSWTLVEHVVRYAEAEGIGAIESIESFENRAALGLEREAGFVTVPGSAVGSEVVLRRELRRPAAQSAMEPAE
jgi:acetyltransferase